MEEEAKVGGGEEGVPLQVGWKAFLGVFSLASLPTEWLETVRTRREYYRSLRASMIPQDEGTDGAVYERESTSQAPDSHEDAHLREEIEKDVNRLFPRGGESFFQDKPALLVLMKNVLFVWAKSYPEVSYRQGMHDLLCVLVYVLSQREEWRLALLGTELLEELSCPLNLEEDAFMLFERLMSLMAPFYQQLEDGRQRGANEEKESEWKDPNIAFCRALHSVYLRRADPDLQAHLDHLGAHPELYCYRWLRLLLIREFELHQVVDIWSALFRSLQPLEQEESLFQDDQKTFPGPPLLPYLCLSLLLRIRDDLMGLDAAGCLQLLMNLPGVANINDILNQAEILRDPTRQQSPLVDVVRFDAPSLGLSLRQSKSNVPPNSEGRQDKEQQGLAEATLMESTKQSSEPIEAQLQAVTVSGFNALKDGGPPPAQLCGKIRLGDVLIAVNGLCVRGMTTEELASRVQRVGRPVYLAFEHAPSLPLSSLSPSVTTAVADVQRFLLPGEILFADVEGTSFQRGAGDSGNSNCVGRLYLTNYRCIFHQPGSASVRWSLPLLLVSKLDTPVAQEYKRLGFLSPASDSWRIFDQRFELCRTYPRRIVVPAYATDNHLQRSATFRSLGRFPVAVWVHPRTGAVLARSAQPLVGVKGQRRTEDEELVLFTLKAAGNMGKEFAIVDARSQLASVGNRAMGKGTETPSNYPGSRIMFMNIDNIHALRESFKGLTALFQPQAQHQEDFYLRVHTTGWLKHVRNVLVASSAVADLLETRGESVLTHCSDGWDRTAQMVSLAQLMLDPYYRTVEGFMVLVEKDWCSFGHQFALRSGHLSSSSSFSSSSSSSSSSSDEFSPVFLLFLDCVWQIQRQFPHLFQFSERLLLFLADQTFACKFGTFVFNSEFARAQNGRPAPSVWSFLSRDLTPFLSNEYKMSRVPLFPNLMSKNIRLWEGYFCRWDETTVPYCQPYSGY